VLFSALLLSVPRNERLQGFLSWRPLVGLGVASYSVYLVHDPVVEASEYLTSGWLATPLLWGLGIAAGICAGVLFHVAVEQWCMRPGTQRVVLPLLRRWLRWTDSLYPDVSREEGSAPAAAPVAATAATSN
jgi:peptidoglycan/LPS O-acetylase OafA/YrhL